jgi:hypothetical protein
MINYKLGETGALHMSYRGGMSYKGCEVNASHVASNSSFLAYLYLSLSLRGSNVREGFVVFLTH